MKTIVCPAEYIHIKTNSLVNTVMTAKDSNGLLVIVYKTDLGLAFTLSVKKFLEEFSNALDGKKIETSNEIHRDDDLDVFKSFQESTQKEVGEITIDG